MSIKVTGPRTSIRAYGSSQLRGDSSTVVYPEVNLWPIRFNGLLHSRAFIAAVNKPAYLPNTMIHGQEMRTRSQLPAKRLVENRGHKDG
jgi:hypothetical protein